MKKLALFLLAASLLLTFACGGGGGNGPVSGDDSGRNQQQDDNNDGSSSSIPIQISADQTEGAAPLTVNFTAVPRGGEGPYTFEWFFDGSGDATVDSNQQSPHHTFSTSTVVRVVVTDNTGQVGRGSISILVNDEPISRPDDPQEMDVQIAALGPQGQPIAAGRVPVTVNFRSRVIAGEPPFEFEWDFQGDGTPDSFVQNPTHEFTSAGTPTEVDGETMSVHNVTLTVTDGRGIQVSETYPLTISAEGMTISLRAEPSIGQAPLSANLNASVSGGSPPYEFAWEFGDGQSLDFQSQSSVEHVYTESGEFEARVSVRDSAGQITTSAPIRVQVTEQQVLEVDVEADVTDSPVPFASSITTIPTGGSPPLEYDWTVRSWNDNLGDGDGEVDPETELGPIPSQAIIAPETSNRANPNFHFANNAGPFAVRVGITDANGSTAFSRWIPIETQPPTLDYIARRFIANDPQGALKHMFDTTRPRNPQQENLLSPGGRVNPVVLGHPSGVMFVFGGEILAENGNFESAVSQADAAWALRIDRQTDQVSETATSSGPFGDGITPAGDSGAYPADTWVLLNTFRSNPFPNQPNQAWCNPNAAYFNQGQSITWSGACNTDRATNRPHEFHQSLGDPPAPEVTNSPPGPPPSRLPTQRSTGFVPVGMAGGALVRTQVITNEANSWGNYNISQQQCPSLGQTQGTYMPNAPLATPAQTPNYLLPPPLRPQMSPPGNWRVGSSSLASQGGITTAYIVGGRSDRPTINSQPSRTGNFFVSADVQKYIVPGFGTEDLPMDNVDLTAHEGGSLRPCSPASPEFQLTMNQVDSWVNTVSAPDRDQLPGDDNTVDTLTTGQDFAQLEPALPSPLYGHSVVTLDSRLQIPQPTFPEQPFQVLLAIGGKTAQGEVINEVRARVPSLDPSNRQGGGGPDEQAFGFWSLEAELQQARYDFQAQVLPPNPNRGRPWRILVWGGKNANNEPVRTVEMLEIDDPNNLQNQDVQQFQELGELPEGRFGAPGGYIKDQIGIRMFEAGGRTVDSFKSSILSFTESAGGPQSQAVTVSPRVGASGTLFSLNDTAFGAHDPTLLGGITNTPRLNRFAIFGGQTETGRHTNWVEVFKIREQ